jgi:PAS domain S-box-containing protein
MTDTDLDIPATEEVCDASEPSPSKAEGEPLQELILAEAGLGRAPFQGILDALPSPVFIKDADGVYLACNPAFERFVGRPRAEIIGRTVDQLWPVELAQRYATADRELLATGGRQVYEGRVEDADGTLHDVVFDKITFNHANGTPAGIIGVMLDISERRERERALRESLDDQARRIGQLKCLHGLSLLITRKLPPERFLPAVARLVHSERQSNGCTGVRITLDGRTFVSTDFETTSQVSSKELSLNPDHELLVEAFYRPTSCALNDQEDRLISSVGSHAGAYLERYLAEESLRRHLALESAVSRITSRFAAASDVDSAIRTALGEVALEIGASRANLLVFDTQGLSVVDVVEWCADGIPSIHDRLLDLELREFPWWHDRLLEGETIFISDPRSLPPEARAVKKLLLELGSGSILAVPIFHDGKLRGFASFASIGAYNATWSGQESAILTVFAEMASRTMVREEKTRRIAQLAAAVQQSGDGILITDIAGVVTYVNRAAEQVTGYGSGEMLGRRLQEFVPTDDGRNFFPTLWTSVRQGLPWHGQLSLTRPDGSDYEEDCKISPIRDADGEIDGFLVMKRDITEKVRLEAQLRQAQKLESIGQLAAGIAHEINTPVQYVGDNARFLKEAFADLGSLIQNLQRRVDDQEATGAGGLASSLRAELDQADVAFLLEEAPSAISQSLEGIERIRSIVLAMRDFAHPGSPRWEPVDLNAGIRNTVTISRNVWKYDAELELDLDEDLPLVPCDGAAINQAILNLVSNAAHAITESRKRSGTTELGRLNIRSRFRDQWAEITVSDTGDGIPQEIRERVFDPFFTTKEVGVGTGQGLSIVHNVIVEKHNGEIDLETREGEGTTFRVRIPSG